MERLNPKSRSDPYGSRLNRNQSAFAATIVPWVSILFASALPQFVVITALPIIPPLGYMMLLAWRLARPGLLPLWAGFPLGLFDDLVSGQPFGFAIFVWSLTMLFLEIVDTRFPWRNFIQDWFTAGLMIVLYILIGVTLSGASLSREMFVATGPQIVLSIFLFPIIARLVARLDRLRLRRWRTVG